ncbi:hypothetical protein RDV78_01170 [Bacillota bacterium LX-D]|nr:hypothetical protein [Bacillota bacterium LX-D]
MPNEKDNFNLESEIPDIIITQRLSEEFLQSQGLGKNLTAKHLFIFGLGAVLTGYYSFGI